MSLFNEKQKAQLLANGHRDNRDRDHAPVVKLILPGTGCVWLLSEIDPEDPDIAFGLCDLGTGFPELGSVSISELQSLRFGEGRGVRQDDKFVAHFPMSVFAAARNEQSVTDDPYALVQASKELANFNKRTQAPKPS